jgi:hypothetical protein
LVCPERVIIFKEKKEGSKTDYVRGEAFAICNACLTNQLVDAERPRLGINNWVSKIMYNKLDIAVGKLDFISKCPH